MRAAVARRRRHLGSTCQEVLGKEVLSPVPFKGAVLRERTEQARHGEIELKDDPGQPPRDSGY